MNAALQRASEPALDLVYMRAKCSYETGDYYTAVADTGKVLKQHPTHLDAYQVRGDSYFYLGEFEAALNHYRTALKYDPEHKGCKAGHKKLKLVQKKVKRGDDAKEAGKNKDALKFYREAIDAAAGIMAFIRPTQLKVIDCLSALGRHEEAIDMAHALHQEEETIEHEIVLGDALLAAEKYDEAVRTYQSAMENAEDATLRKQAQQKLQKAQVAQKQAKTKNYYKILGVSRKASKKEIKSAYRKLALEWHPDKNIGENQEKAEKMFHDISEAYEVLSDDDLRVRYDRGEDVMGDGSGGAGGGGGFGRGHNPFEFMQQHAGGMGGGGGRGQRMHFQFH